MTTTETSPAATMLAAQLRQTILAASDLKSTEVYIPEWDVRLTLRELSVADRVLISRYKEDGKESRFLELVCVLAVRDAAGTPVFTHADIEALGAKNPVALQRIANTVLELSGLDQSGEDTEKN